MTLSNIHKQTAIAGIFALTILGGALPVHAEQETEALSRPFVFFLPGVSSEIADFLKEDDKVVPTYTRISSDHRAALSGNEKPATKEQKSAQVDKAQKAQPLVQVKGRKFVRSTSNVMATAYSSTVDQTDSSPCTTANGFNVCKHNQENVIAANFLPFGTRVRMPDMFGDRVFVVQDRMNARYRNGRVDIWMKTRTAALKFGVKQVALEVLDDQVAVKY